MDLDGDKITTALEKSAYFIRNSYLVCRPVRLPVIKNLSRKREWEEEKFYSMLDMNKDQKITIEDFQSLMKDFDLDGDKNLTAAEFTNKTAKIV